MERATQTVGVGGGRETGRALAEREEAVPVCAEEEQVEAIGALFELSGERRFDGPGLVGERGEQDVLGG